MKKRDWVERTAAYLLSILFVSVGLSKLLGHRDFVITLGESPLVGDFVPWLAYPLPLLELFAGGTLLTAPGRRYGFLASAIMMVSFTAYSIYLVRFAPYVPCSCGGIFNQLSWTNHLYINSAFTTLALAGSWLTWNKRKPHIKDSAVSGAHS